MNSKAHGHWQRCPTSLCSAAPRDWCRSKVWGGGAANNQRGGLTRLGARMSGVSSRAWAPKAELSLQAPLPSWIPSHPPRRVIAVAISPKPARLAGPNFQSPSSAAEMPATPSTSRRKSAAKPETPRDLKGKKLLVPREVFPKVPSQPFSGRSVNFGKDRRSHKARARRRRHAHWFPRQRAGSWRLAAQGSPSTHPPAVLSFCRRRCLHHLWGGRRG